MTRTAGAPIGCQRPSRFWGLGCPKIYHEAEDTLEKSATVRSDSPTVKAANHLAPTQGLKFQLFWFTLCIHRPLC
ncbi:hypothetical protein, partial [Thiolapillus sp.]